jgi:hypothetical protein
MEETSMKLVTKREWNLIQEQIRDLKEQVATLRSLLAKPRKPAPPPTKQVSEPLDSDEAQRVSRILAEGISGTKWQKRKRQIEQSFKQQPSEIEVKTGATKT